MKPSRPLALLASLTVATAVACASGESGLAASSAPDPAATAAGERDPAAGSPPPTAAAVAHEAEPQVPWATQEADALRPLVHAAVSRAFLDAAGGLPAGRARTLHRDAGGRWLAESDLDGVPPDARSAVQVTADSYYTTKYGSPLAWVRVLEHAGDAGLDALAGKRVLDFGAGTVGHLRLLALAGAHATGLDVDPFLAALYAAPGATGEVDRWVAPEGGEARLLVGSWPGDAALRDAVGEGYDLVTSKNTLKRGYIHPEREVDPRLLVHLGVDDATFLAHVRRVLVPGGLFVIENLSPAQDASGARYVPWADGRSPFTREQLDLAGFDVLAFDVVGDEAARLLGRALGWDEKGMDLERDLFEHATVARRRADPR